VWRQLLKHLDRCNHGTVPRFIMLADVINVADQRSAQIGLVPLRKELHAMREMECI